MPLGAAMLAALAAHVAIDIAGDYLLPHDTFDDDAHGSRWLASAVLATSALGTVWFLANAVLAETRGARGALRAALRASVPASAGAFVALVAAGALPLVIAMGGLDAYVAGARIDGLADLLGGSLPLGTTLTFALAAASGIGTHRLVGLLSRHQRSIVRVVGTLVRATETAEHGICPPLLATKRTQDRARVPAALVRSMGANRAPPGQTRQALPV
jgi:hypothetical protein